VTTSTGTARGLVVAKAPVAGEVKTRLGADVGHESAARLAAAALLDTLDAMEAAFGVERCHVAITGDLERAVDGDRLQERLASWTVHAQRGQGLGARLAYAHADVASTGSGGVVQVGMDTPQITASLLSEVAASLAEHRAVLGPAEDGGWWVLALADPRQARALHDVPMSTERTCHATEAALVKAGLDVGRSRVLCDVDTVVEAEAVAVDAPWTRFSRLWDVEVRPRLVAREAREV
jgi:rSAM/selenodomain-associated transferase 1